MLRKARDARIIRMTRALAGKGQRVYLLIGQTAARVEEILNYYGVSPTKNLSIFQLPILRGRGHIRITINQVFLWAAFWKAWRIHRKEPIQIFYFSVLQGADFFLRMKRFFPGAKFIYEMHELVRYPENLASPVGRVREEGLEKRVLSGVDGVLTTTEVIRKVVEDRFPNLPSTTIPLGMAPIKATPPAHFGADGRFKICYVGQLYDAQGVDVLIKGIALIPQVEAHIIGGTAAEVMALKKLAKELGVLERVVFHGFVEPGQVWNRIKDMDIFAVPAKNTIRMNYVAHIKIYEYMASQRPIVATRLRSIEEDLEDGRTAILVEPDDHRSFAEGVRKLMDHPERAREIAKRAYEQSTQYHWERRAESILRFISSLSEKRPEIEN